MKAYGVSGARRKSERKLIGATERTLHSLQRNVLVEHDPVVGALLKREAELALAKHANEVGLGGVPHDPGGLPLGIVAQVRDLDITVADLLQRRYHRTGRESHTA